ncbi:hypothetical protein SLA2020_347090 [Shorea laevis]
MREGEFRSGKRELKRKEIRGGLPAGEDKEGRASAEVSSSEFGRSVEVLTGREKKAMLAFHFTTSVASSSPSPLPWLPFWGVNCVNN